MLLSRGDLILIYSRVPNKLVFAVVTSALFPPLLFSPLLSSPLLSSPLLSSPLLSVPRVDQETSLGLRGVWTLITLLSRVRNPKLSLFSWTLSSLPGSSFETCAQPSEAWLQAAQVYVYTSSRSYEREWPLLHLPAAALFLFSFRFSCISSRRVEAATENEREEKREDWGLERRRTRETPSPRHPWPIIAN